MERSAAGSGALLPPAARRLGSSSGALCISAILSCTLGRRSIERPLAAPAGWYGCAIRYPSASIYGLEPTLESDMMNRPWTDGFNWNLQRPTNSPFF